MAGCQLRIDQLIRLWLPLGMGGLSRQTRAPARLAQVIAAITALAFAAAGCSYQSSYVAPADGRARVVWGPGDTPTLELVGNLSSQCTTELSQILYPAPAPLFHSHVNLQPAEFWVPRYYGPHIVVIRPGLAPRLPHLPVFVPGLGAPHLPPPVRVIGLGDVVRPGGVAHVSGGTARGGGGSRGSSNFGGGKEAGAVIIVLVVITLSVLPAVALGLAASMPESAKKTSSAIDLANVYNDLARADGSPCTAAPPPPEFPPGTLPQPEPLR